MVMEDIGFLGGDDVRVRIEHLLQQRRAGAGMAAKQGQPMRRLKFLTGFLPALEDIRAELLAKFLELGANPLCPGDMRRGGRCQERLGGLKCCHGFIVTVLPIQNVAQFVMRLCLHIPFDPGRECSQNALRFREPARLPFQSGTDQQGGRKSRFYMQRALNQLPRFLQLALPFGNFRQGNERLGRGILLLCRELVIMPGQLMISEIERPQPGARQRFHFVRGKPDGLFKTPFRGGVIEVVAVGVAEIQQQADIGRIEPAGALQYFDALLKFVAIPRFVRGVQQAGQSAP